MKWHALLAILLAWGTALAQTDPAAARAQLEIGYDLRQKGEFAEAVVHLRESYRLDPQVKALINLADCEEHIGRLVDAEQHWVEARDRAARDGDTLIQAEADRRIVAVTKRMPKLTIRLSHDAPPDAVVMRDGAQLGAVSLGVALPLDPGHHAITVHATAHDPSRTDVDLAEGESKDIDVTVGSAVARAETTPVIFPPPIIGPPTAVENHVFAEPPPSTARTASVVLIVGGGVASGIAIATGIGALVNYATLTSHCDTVAKTCDSTGLHAASDGAGFATATDVLGGIGLSALAVGVVMFFVSKPSKPSPVSLNASCATPLGLCVGGAF